MWSKRNLRGSQATEVGGALDVDISKQMSAEVSSVRIKGLFSSFKQPPTRMSHPATVTLTTPRQVPRLRAGQPTKDPVSQSVSQSTHSARLIKRLSRLLLWPSAAKLAGFSLPASESYRDNFRAAPLISRDNISAATS